MNPINEADIRNPWPIKAEIAISIASCGVNPNC